MYLSHSKSFLFRFSHGARFRTAVRLIDAQPDQTILDYGCADGRLLKMLPCGKLLGYDPNPQNVEGLEMVADTSVLPDCSCDTITICEVFEHVSLVEVNRILRECQRLLKPQGKLIVTVPIEVGVSALVKSLARWIKVRPLEKNMTLANVFRSVLYLSVQRVPDYAGSFGDVYGHMGFDYRKLNLTGFAISRKLYSPLPFGPLLNSQVFLIAKVV
jgi:ubiquinone/menaquinone biosynthesis C-methylase UbiE